MGFVRFTVIAFWIISKAVYIAVMLAGYMTFGASSQGLILNNYASQDLLAKIGRAATGPHRSCYPYYYVLNLHL